MCVCLQEVEPSVGEKLCRLWQKVESDEDALSGRPGGSRDHKSLASGSGSHGGEGSQGSFSRHGQPHVPSYPPPMYFPYPMGPSMFTSAGGGDARSRIGLQSHPYFSHLPRLGYSSAQPHLPPPSLLHSDGGGGGHYRPGRPWWTVPPFPPPSHLHHPHHSHPPPMDSNYHEPASVQEQHPPPSSQHTSVTTAGHENMATSTTTSVPRTSSRNAYSQQRISILKKQQQHKEQASKSAREQDKTNLYMTTSALNSLRIDESPKVNRMNKSSEGASLLVLSKSDVSKEDEGVHKLEVTKLSSKFMPSQ